ncbi:MAG: hypothetical protein L3J05_07590 [Robiginitomaculum sp.]|nr:hypothetical protein [Robiginitomaculum sp.]
MKSVFTTTAILAPLVILGACTTTPVEEMIVAPPPIEQTCIPINTLKMVVIPAVTKSGFSIVSIDTEPQQIYDDVAKKWITVETPPIERREAWTKVITPEQIIYVDAENKEVTDICELNVEKPNDVVKEPKQTPESE